MSLRLTTTLGAMALALAAVLPAATSSQAAVAQGFVNGWDKQWDDFDDEGTLSRTSYSHSNAVAMWQLILVADKAHRPDGSLFTAADVDCRFGPTTEYATKDWQRKFSLSADGIVGPKTFHRAGSNLLGPVKEWNVERVEYWSGTTTQGTTFWRSLEDGHYSFQMPSGLKIDASYTRANACS
ncbi:peptidoglycan-binding protein [Streptomyces sp. NPDC093094]|uniref:peptidoglycan-binding domain-containing protein n=1 Tax=Streptomyces sp. NPDC093094 TaxID=3366026 RepID=UPI003829F375